MKSILVLNSALWFLLAVKHGQSIQCFECDSETGVSCTGEMNIIDCSLDPEYGDTYDSCFSMTAYNGRKRVQIKDCSISFGCEELEDILCENYTNAQNSTGKKCRLECCKDELCNDNNVGSSNTTKSQAFMLLSFVAVSFAIAFISPW